jgi:hypothetical protein
VPEKAKENISEGLFPDNLVKKAKKFGEMK